MGGADRDRWVARLRERMREQRDELLDAPAFTVFGLAAPALWPYAVLDFRRDHLGWSYVVLGYGDALSFSAPRISVRTHSRGARPDEPEEPLADVLAAEIARNASLTGGPGPEAGTPGTARTSAAVLTVGGRRVEVDLCRQGERWAARVEPANRLLVTVVAGGQVRPEDVRLVPVDDLGPYWRGRRDLTDRMAGLPYQARLLGTDQPWPAGLDPHRALLDHVVRTGRRGGKPWRQAVRAHAALTGTHPDAAAAALRDLAGHVRALVEHADWFADPDLRHAATEELLRRAVLGEDVRSRPAQDAWTAWVRHRDTPDRDAARAEWLAAWSTWASS